MRSIRKTESSSLYSFRLNQVDLLISCAFSSILNKLIIFWMYSIATESAGGYKERL